MFKLAPTLAVFAALSYSVRADFWDFKCNDPNASTPVRQPILTGLVWIAVLSDLARWLTCLRATVRHLFNPCAPSLAPTASAFRSRAQATTTVVGKARRECPCCVYGCAASLTLAQPRFDSCDDVSGTLYRDNAGACDFGSCVSGECHGVRANHALHGFVTAKRRTDACALSLTELRRLLHTER